MDVTVCADCRCCCSGVPRTDHIGYLPQVHKLKLAKQCVSDLDSGAIATEVGPMALALYKWVLMILDVQGL